MGPEDYGETDDQMADGDGLRARSEQAIGEIAQALIDSPTLHSALQAAFGARDRALEAQQAAFGALNLPSAGDVERLEDAEEQIDDLNREIATLRRKIAAKGDKADAKSADA